MKHYNPVLHGSRQSWDDQDKRFKGGIGGALKSVGNAVGSSLSVGNAVGSALGSLGGVGNVLGPAVQLASGANPLGVFGASMGSQLAKQYAGAGGDKKNPIYVTSTGEPIYATHGYDYGSNTYRVGKKAIDADPYFIEGSKGIYNLLPELSNLYGNKATRNLEGTSSYNVYQNIYNRMAGDELAQQKLAEQYGPKTLNLGWSATKNIDPALARLRSGKIGGYDFTYTPPETALPAYVINDLKRTAAEQELALLKSLPKTGAERQAALTGYDPTDMQYVDWGFGKGAVTRKQPWEALANYSARKSNPFFVAFAPEAAATPSTEGAAATAATVEGKASGGITSLMRDK